MICPNSKCTAEGVCKPKYCENLPAEREPGTCRNSGRKRKKSQTPESIYRGTLILTQIPRRFGWRRALADAGDDFPVQAEALRGVCHQQQKSNADQSAKWGLECDCEQLPEGPQRSSLRGMRKVCIVVILPNLTGPFSAASSACTVQSVSVLPAVTLAWLKSSCPSLIIVYLSADFLAAGHLWMFCFRAFTVDGQ